MATSGASTYDHGVGCFSGEKRKGKKERVAAARGEGEGELGFRQEATRWRILRGKKGAGGGGHGHAGHVRALLCLRTEEEEKARVGLASGVGPSPTRLAKTFF